MGFQSGYLTKWQTLVNEALTNRDVAILLVNFIRKDWHSSLILGDKVPQSRRGMTSEPTPLLCSYLIKASCCVPCFQLPNSLQNYIKKTCT